MVTHPLKSGTRARAAIEPGYALTEAYKVKMRVTADQCDQQGIAFIPVVAESLGGWHKVGLEQLRKLGSALARHTGQEELETISHLLTRASCCCRRSFLLSCSTGSLATQHQRSEEPYGLYLFGSVSKLLTTH